MVRILDEADYPRRLDAAGDLDRGGGHAPCQGHLVGRRLAARPSPIRTRMRRKRRKRRAVAATAPWVYFEVIQGQTALRGVPMLFKSYFTIEDYEGDIDGSTSGTSGLILVRSDFGSQSA
jgi:hypothetical protein